MESLVTKQIMTKDINTSDSKYLDECLLSIKNGDLSYMSNLYNATNNNILCN